jgi:hypothetical protein
MKKPDLIGMHAMPRANGEQIAINMAVRSHRGRPFRGGMIRLCIITVWIVLGR